MWYILCVTCLHSRILLHKEHFFGQKSNKSMGRTRSEIRICHVHMGIHHGKSGTILLVISVIVVWVATSRGGVYR